MITHNSEAGWCPNSAARLVWRRAGLAALATLSGLVGSVHPVAAQQYRAIVLHPPGFRQSFAMGVGGYRTVGYRERDQSADHHAVWWRCSAGSVVDLHPGLLSPIGTPFEMSEALGAAGDQQVGRALYPGGSSAILWTGTAATAIDLTPPGTFTASASATDGLHQVGHAVGPLAGSLPHAFLWSGTVLSAVDLHPPLYSRSFATDVARGQQVGYGNREDDPALRFHRALLWFGTAGSAVELHPDMYARSVALATDGLRQAGWAQNVEGEGFGSTRALLWAGHAGSFVDLHPAGYRRSAATGISGDYQCGYADMLHTWIYRDHAIVWKGTPESAVDLHALLPPAEKFEASVATGVDAFGSVSGYAWTSDMEARAVLWLRIPELISFAISPGTVKGGNSVSGTVTLSQPTTCPIEVTLASRSPKLVVPPSAIVPAGETAATFEIGTKPVRDDQIATATASLGPTALRASVLILSPDITSLTIDPESVTGGFAASGVVTLDGPASDEGAYVDLSSSNDDVAWVPLLVEIPPGAITGSFGIDAEPVRADTPVDVTGTSPRASAKAKVTVLTPRVASIGFDPNPVPGEQSSTGTVELTGPAPTDGILLKLIYAPGIPATMPISLLIPEGELSEEFEVDTKPVKRAGSWKVTALRKEIASQAEARLTIAPLEVEQLAFTPNEVIGGVTVRAQVTLNGNAPVGGIDVLLTSDEPEAVVPDRVNIPGGARSAEFDIKTRYSAEGVTVYIWANTEGGDLDSEIMEQLEIESCSQQLLTLDAAADEVAGGVEVSGVATIDNPAPPGGLAIYFASDIPFAADVEHSPIIIPEGETTAGFTIKTNPILLDENVGIYASLCTKPNAETGESDDAWILTVLGTGVPGLNLRPSSAVGGSSAEGLVILDTPAPKGGIAVEVSSDSTAATPGLSRFNIPAGAQKKSFSIKTAAVGLTTQATISATYSGATRSAVLTVLVPEILSVRLPRTARGGRIAWGRVILNGAAPPMGTAVLLSSSDPAVALPAQSVIVRRRRRTAPFKITTQRTLSNVPVVITASVGSSIKTNGMTVRGKP